MATLELVVDATRAVSGSQQAEAALGRVKTAAEATGKAVADSGARMSAAFQASGGTIQVAGGIAQTAKAFADLNVQAGLFNTSRLLLEVGKTAQDFRELRGQVGGVGTVLQTLGAIIRANPILTLATAVGAIAGAMSLFGSETKKAADAYDQLGNSFRKAQLDAKTAAYLGVPYTPDLAQQQRDVFSMVQQAQTSGQGINFQTLGEFGYGNLAANYLAEFGTSSQRGPASYYMQTGGVARTGMRAVPGLQMMQPYSYTEPGFPDVQLSAGQTQEVLRILNDRLRQQMDTRGIVDMPGGYYPGGAIGPEPDYQMAAEMAREDERRVAAAQAAADESERVAENIRQAADYAANIGSTVGAAFADVLLKTTSVRQAFQQIVASIARQGLSDVGASIFRGVVGAVAGGTPTQVKGNTGAIPGGG